MLHQDYLMRMMLNLVAAMRRSLERAQGQADPEGSAALLEAAIGEATDIDGGVLLSLSPESIATILQVSGADPRLIEHLSRSLLLTSAYWEQSGNQALANLRSEQARALAASYGIDLSGEPPTLEELEELAIELGEQEV